MITDCLHKPRGGNILASSRPPWPKGLSAEVIRHFWESPPDVGVEIISPESGSVEGGQQVVVAAPQIGPGALLSGRTSQQP